MKKLEEIVENKENIMTAAYLENDRFVTSDALFTVVMTTAPREEPTIKKSLDSVARAGFPCPIVFAEPDSYVPNHPHIMHPERLGVWHNWLAAARHAIYCGTPYVMTLQDDIDMHPDTYELIRQLIPFKDDVGCLSLYTSHIYGTTPGIQRIKSPAFWGSLALVFRTDALKTILWHKLVHKWRGLNYADNKADIIDDDMAIGKIVRLLNMHMYCVLPSPVVHIGHTSSIRKPHPNKGFKNTALASDFDEPLLAQVPQSTWSAVSLTQL